MNNENLKVEKSVKLKEANLNLERKPILTPLIAKASSAFTRANVYFISLYTLN